MKARAEAGFALVLAAVVDAAAAAVVVVDGRGAAAVVVVEATHATRLRARVAAAAATAVAVTAVAVAVAVNPLPAQARANSNHEHQERITLKGRAPKRAATVALRCLVRHRLSAEDGPRWPTFDNPMSSARATSTPNPSSVPRTALLAGSSGLVGSALLPLLLASNAYGQTHALLRRALPGLTASQKLTLHVVDFQALPLLPPVDDVYIALGTTIKVAGSEAAFRLVDFDAVVNTARASRAAGATRLAVVSALGADVESRVFYNRVKGEMQAAVCAMGYTRVVIAQPSLLLGNRATLGQPKRSGEEWAMRLLGPVMRLVPRSVRPIPATAVASALVAAMVDQETGVRVLRSAHMSSAHMQL